MNNLIVDNRFNEMFGSLDIIKTNDDKVLFKANDVLRALGYKEGNWRTTLSRKCKGVAKCNVPHPQNPNKEIEVNFITEGDVYRLIASSKLPQAEKFEKWVMEDVLPSIRKHGAYMTESVIEKALTSPDFLIQLATQLKEEKEKRQIAENEVGQFLDTNNLLKWDTVAKNLKIGKNTMLRELREMKILQTDEFEYRGSKCHGERHNVPYQAYMKYFEVKYKVKGDKRYPIVLVKASGQEYLYKRLLKVNII